MKKFLLGLLVIVLLVAVGYAVTHRLPSANSADTSYAPGYVSGKDVLVSPQPSLVAKTGVGSTVADGSVLGDLKGWIPQVVWGVEKSETMDLAGTSYTGTSMSGSYVSDKAGVTDLGERDHLLSTGWSDDTALAAGGANGNAWGYTADREGGKELLYLSYTNVSFTPPPQGTKCPCTFHVKVFHSVY